MHERRADTSYQQPAAPGGPLSSGGGLGAVPRAVLYEMVTGRPRFIGDDPVAIIGQHVDTPPVAPTWNNQSCPTPLEALILRLLAEDPSERPEAAAVIVTIHGSHTNCSED